MAAKGRVQNLVAIVTGAGSGIGQASAIRLAEEGATVVCADRNSGSLEITKKLIADLNLHSESYVIDISESKSCDELVTHTVNTYGSIDILVNNAGVNLPGVFHEVSNETIDQTLDINVKGAMSHRYITIGRKIIS